MLSNTTSHMFFYVYVLESLKDSKRYIGYTNNLKKRIKKHEDGKALSTRSRLPVKLIYFESCLDESDAKLREQYFKTTQARRFLGLRLINYKKQTQSALNGRMIY